MERVDPSRGVSRMRKRIAGVVALVGIAFVGAKLSRAWPREVDVAYQTDSSVRRLDVDILVEGEAVSSARFHRPAGVLRPFSHTVTLQPGQYEAKVTVYGEDGRGTEFRRLLLVPADGLTRFDLRE